jgi:hypothetical protein
MQLWPQCYAGWYSAYCGGRSDGAPFLAPDGRGVYSVCAAAPPRAPRPALSPWWAAAAATGLLARSAWM